MTAEAVQKVQHEPKPEIFTSLLLREQTRGIAEGHPWITEPKPGLPLEEHYTQGLFPIHHERWQKFPGGESLEDLAVRADRAVKEVILPHVLALSKSEKQGAHIAVASHGLFIAEMIPALLKLDPTSGESRTTYRGMLNTGWTRVTVEIVVSRLRGSVKERANGVIQGEPGQNEVWPEVRVRVTDFNSHAHLNSIVSKERRLDGKVVFTSIHRYRWTPVRRKGTASRPLPETRKTAQLRRRRKSIRLFQEIERRACIVTGH